MRALRVACLVCSLSSIDSDPFKSLRTFGNLCQWHTSVAGWGRISRSSGPTGFPYRLLCKSLSIYCTRATGEFRSKTQTIREAHKICTQVDFCLRSSVRPSGTWGPSFLRVRSTSASHALATAFGGCLGNWDPEREPVLDLAALKRFFNDGAAPTTEADADSLPGES